MIRVLHVLGSLSCGGIQTTLMNLYRNIDRSNIQFDFLISLGAKKYYEEEARSLGARIFRRPMRTKNPVGNMAGLVRVLKKHPEITIVHIHNATTLIAIDSLLAMLCNVPVRIAHSHSAPAISLPMQKTFRPLLRATATHWAGCSTDAGISMFGEKIHKSNKWVFLPNAQNLEPFRFDVKRRNDVREKLGLNGKLVLLSAGRLEPVKNHLFLLEVLACALKEYPELILLIAGEGSLEKALLNKAAGLGATNFVRLLGIRNDIPDLMQAADVFLFPSLHEGFGISAIEAQAAGLPCLLSDTIPAQAKVTNLVEFLPICQGPEIWAQRILAHKAFSRYDTLEDVRNSGYDVMEAVKKLEDFYTGKNIMLEGL